MAHLVTDIQFPGGDSVRLAGYLDPATTPELEYNLVVRCAADFVILEVPPGSNRGGRVDKYNGRFGSPLGSSWCANTCAAHADDVGADYPGRKQNRAKYGRTLHPGSCDDWATWAIFEGLWSATPALAAVVLYGHRTPRGVVRLPDGTRADATHAGRIVRHEPRHGILVSAEGNTTAGRFDREGGGFWPKPVDTSRVLGYVLAREAQ